MRAKLASFLATILRGLAWPFRQIWRFIGRLGLAERKIIQGTWRYLGRLGLALKELLRRPLLWLSRPFLWLGRLLVRILKAVWRRLGIWGLALRGPLTRILNFFWRPLRWLGERLWRLVRWAAPLLWEEFGRLGKALRRLLEILSWPFVTLAKLIWNRLLGPPLLRLRDWLQLRHHVARRAYRSRKLVRQARQAVRRREKAALAVHQPPSAARTRRRWIRIVAALLALNLVLAALLIRAAIHYRPPAEAGLTIPPTPLLATATPLRLPTHTPWPTAIPITPAPTPDRLATGGSVAFVLRQNGNDDIYALTVGRTEPIRLTQHPADDRSPAWSPDGRRLAFASRRDGNWELYLLDVPTGELARLTRHVSYQARPSWSPDGQWLVYEGYHEENLDIYIMPVGGGEAVRLTQDPAADYAPVWSPSGRHLAFISWRSGNPDIYLLSLDDARDEAAVNLSQSLEIAEDHPRWHPGGDYIAYSGRSGNQELLFVQAMANNLPSGEPVLVGQGREPAWAPSGTSLVYVHEDQGRQYLLAGSVNGWGAAPQVHLAQHPLSAPDWNAWGLLPGLPDAGDPAEDAPLYLEFTADPAEGGAPYTLVTLEDIQARGPYLSDRVDDSFQALRERIKEEAGWDFLAALDKLWEPMEALAPPGLDGESWNKAGRAFDIIADLNAGYQPLVEVLREELGTQTYWRVFVRTQRQDGSQGAPLTVRPWNFAARYSGNTSDYEAGGRVKESIPIGYYVDFTQLAADYGWQRVPAGNTWRTNAPATLYWHFENRQNLDWETAMLELYMAKELYEGTAEETP